MTKAAHTAGPWSVAPHYGEQFYSGTILGGDGRSVCSINGTIKRDPDEKRANARLIAAAPDYEAAARATLDYAGLAEWLDNPKGHPNDVWAIRREHLLALRAAIAKAEGRS